MKSISPTLKAHISGAVVTIAWCWLVTRKDGQVFGFTTHIKPLQIGAITYQMSAGFTASDVHEGNTLAVNNMEVKGVIMSSSITQDDLRAGRWDGADLEIFYVNYEDLTQGQSNVFTGTIGHVTTGRLSFTAEMRGLTQPLQQNLGGPVSNQCHYVLGAIGNPNCNVDLVPFTRTGTITAVTSARVFTDVARSEAAHWWRGGNFTVTSGASNGLKMEVKESSAAGLITLVLPLYFGLAIGDTYSMKPGCDHLLRLTDGTYGGDCKGKYHNVDNFPGFVRTPGQDKISVYAGAGGGG